MKEEIRALLADLLPLADIDADFLFAQLSSLDVTSMLMALADKYGITLDATDATPRNLKSLDSIVAMVQHKLLQP